jgi:hypothetical protein
LVGLVSFFFFLPLVVVVVVVVVVDIGGHSFLLPYNLST